MELKVIPILLAIPNLLRDFAVSIVLHLPDLPEQQRCNLTRLHPPRQHQQQRVLLQELRRVLILIHNNNSTCNSPNHTPPNNNSLNLLFILIFAMNPLLLGESIILPMSILTLALWHRNIGSLEGCFPTNPRLLLLLLLLLLVLLRILAFIQFKTEAAAAAAVTIIIILLMIIIIAATTTAVEGSGRKTLRTMVHPLDPRNTDSTNHTTTRRDLLCSVTITIWEVLILV